MYTSKLNVLLIGDECDIFEYIRTMQIDTPFEKTVAQSGGINYDKIDTANVVILHANNDFNRQDVLGVAQKCKEDNKDIILVADNEFVDSLDTKLDIFTEIWRYPLVFNEVEYRVNQYLSNRKVKDELVETSHFLDAVMDNSPDMIWIKSMNGIHEKVNNAFCKVVEKTKEQVEGRSHAYIWDVETDDPACIETELKVMSTREIQKSLENVKTSNGIRILETYKSPLYNVDGSVMGTVGTGVDITDKLEFEKGLINKTKELESIFTNLNCGIICHSKDDSGRIISINDEALRILGYETQDDLIHDGFDIVANSVADKDKPRLREEIKNLKKVGSSISTEYEVIHKDGKVKHVTSTIKLIEENGELIYQRLLLDCTAQKEQEKEQDRFNASMFRALSVDYNAVVCFDVDNDTFTIVKDDEDENTAYKWYMDQSISLDENIQSYIRDNVYSEDIPMLKQATSIENILAKLETTDVITVNYRADRNDTIVYEQIKAVKVGGWDKHRYIAIGFRSIDDEIQEELRQKKLLESALNQANEAGKVKSAFLANMSHDMRTPMNAITGFTKLAINNADNSEKVKGYLDKILVSSEILLELIDKALDVVCIENENVTLSEKSCKLSDIMYQVSEIVHDNINKKNIALRIDDSKIKNDGIVCDSLKLKQILLNIISNSIKYTNNDGSIDVTITEDEGEQYEYNKFTFKIKDNGIGISEQFLPHIFEAFEREKNTTLSGVQGTGLGMTITKQLVDIMRGTIDIQSKKGEYTEVTLNFSFKVTGDKKEESFDVSNLPNVKTLIVNNDFSVCDSIDFILEQMDVKVDFTLSYEEAIVRINIAKNHGTPYGMYIISDSLNGVDSGELIKDIQRMYSEQPIIIVTSSNKEVTEKQMNSLGVTLICDTVSFTSELQSLIDNKTKNEESDTTESEDSTKENTEDTTKLDMDRPILIAEDNELNQEIIKEILTDLGYKVELAENGKVALETVMSRGPGYFQVVLMDIQMPEMNGYEATMAIRQLEDKETANVPIIAVTANALDEDKKKAIQSGMDGHISKPIDIGELVEAIQNSH